MGAHATERPGRTAILVGAPFIPAKQAGNTRFVPSEAVDVVLVRWPAEAERRDELAREGCARLLLLDAEVAPPEPSDCLEDWARPPISETDLAARVAGLRRRVGAHGADGPSVDDDGVLHHLDVWVALPPVEARLMGALVERAGTVVSREVLSRAGWPEGSPGRNALDVHVLRLRRRVDPLGLVIRTVRSRGYLLETGHRHMATGQ